ncbi:MAG: GIY-YIG nuclease family protein [Bacteroidota bacterium]
MFWTYAIFSEKFNKIHIGHTNDIDRRLAEHNGATDFKYWTTKYRPWVVFVSISFETRALAMAEEKGLKSGQPSYQDLPLLPSLFWLVLNFPLASML